MTTIRREFWNGAPEELHELFTLKRSSTGATARCALWSNPLGFELRLDVNGSMIRTQVARSYEEIERARAEWHSALVEDGWSA